MSQIKAFFISKSLAILLFALHCIVDVVVGRGVSLELRANWPTYASTPLVEVAEFCAEQSPDLYWSFIDKICSSESEVQERINKLLKATPNTSADDNDDKHDHDSDSVFSEIETLAIDIGISVVPSSLRFMLETSLDLGTYGPRIEFFHSLSAPFGDPCQGQPFVTIQPFDRILCKYEDVEAFLKSTEVREAPHLKTRSTDQSSDINSETNLLSPSASASSSWEHMWPTVSALNERSIATVTLYGTPGASSYCKIHTLLVSLSEELDMTYISQPAFNGQIESIRSRPLQGYGAILDIKNMEYKNVDERSKGQDSDKEQQIDDSLDSNESFDFTEGEAVEGIIFSTLKTRFDNDVNLQSQSFSSSSDVDSDSEVVTNSIDRDLNVLRERLLLQVESGNADTSGEKMKVWRMKDLGLQVTQAIVNAADPVSKFSSLVHSFPVHAQSISSTKVHNSLKEELNQLVALGGLGLIPPNSIYINGIRNDLSAPTFNIFEFMSLIGREYKIQQRIESLQFSRLKQRAVMDVAMQLAGNKGQTESSASFRVDVSKGGKWAIFFLNNLEKDKMYQKWGKSVQALLYPSWQLPKIARNLYTVVIVSDPLSRDGANLLLQMQQIYMNSYPLRFGLVLDCDGGSMTGVSGQDVCAVFNAVKTQVGTRKAFTLLFEMVSNLEVDFSGIGTIRMMQRNELELLYKKLVPNASGDNLFDAILTSVRSPTEEQKTNLAGASTFVANCTSFLRARGLPSNSFSINGIVVDSASIATSISQILGQEQFLLSQMVRSGTLTDKSSSTFALLMATGTAEIESQSSNDEEPSLSVGAVYTRYHPVLSEGVGTTTPPSYFSDPDNRDFDAIEDHFITVSSMEVEVDEDGIAVDRNIDDAYSMSSTILAVPSNQLGYLSVANALEWMVNGVDGKGSDPRRPQRIAYAMDLPKYGCEDEDVELAAGLLNIIRISLCSGKDHSSKCIPTLSQVLKSLASGLSSLNSLESATDNAGDFFDGIRTEFNRLTSQRQSVCAAGGQGGQTMGILREHTR